MEVVRLFLDHDVDVEVRSNDGRTPLHLACLKGRTEVVQLLIGHGAACDIVDNSSWSPLIDASNGGYLELVKILLNHQVRVNIQTNGRRETALHHAIYNAHQELASYLIEREAKCTLQDSVGQTPFHLAVTKGFLKLIQEMVQGGRVSIYNKTEGGDSPLKLACAAGHLEVVAYLLHKGAVLNNMMEDGQAALEVARSKGHNGIVCLLINSGCLDGWYVG